MTDLEERLRDELDNLHPPDLATAVDARLAAGANGQIQSDRSRGRDRLRVALVAATVLLLAAPVAILLWNAFQPATERRPAGTDATLGLRLFVDGQILEVSQGETRLVAEWPAPAAPYAPPVEGKFGIVGLAYGREGVDLWRWQESTGAERLATGTSQAFAVTSDGALAYGVVEQPRMASTQLVMTDLLDGSPGVAVGVPGYVAPIGFVGSRGAVTAGDAGGVTGGVWDGSRIVELPDNGAVVTQPARGYVVVRHGDGTCWDIVLVSEARAIEDGAEADCNFTPQAFSPSGEELVGIEGPLDEGGTRPAVNRVVVVDVKTRRKPFRSEPIPGVRQVAWEEDGRLLVLARSQPGTVSVYRCDVSAGRCGEVWNVDTDADRYTVWLVPRAPSAAADYPPPEGHITVEPSSGPIGTTVRLTGSCEPTPQRQTFLSGVVLNPGSSTPVLGSVNVGIVPADGFDVTFSVPERASELQGTGGGPISVGDRIVFVASPADSCASEPFTVTE